MTEISRVALFGKLNPLAYKAIEGATVFCKLRGNPYVELVHWLTQLLENPQSDLSTIVRHYSLDTAALARDVTTTLDRLPRGSTAISDFSEQIESAIERGWVYGTLMYGDAQVRSGYLLLGMLNTHSLRNALVAISRQFEKIKADDLSDQLATICAKTGESGLGAQDGTGIGSGEPGGESGAMAPAHQDVDHLADLVVASRDRVHLALARLLGQVDGVLFQRLLLAHRGRRHRTRLKARLAAAHAGAVLRT